MKFRLGLLFSALMGAMILFSSLVLFQQHQGAVSENLITVQKNTELGKAVQLREALINIQDYASRREISFSKLERFRNLLEDFSAQSSLDTRNFLDRIGSHFEEYVSAADNLRGAGEVQSRYDKVANDLGTLVEKKQGEIIQAADSLRQQQKRSTETGILLLTIFMLILMIGAMKMISHVTEPLSVLAHFLDQVNVEDDLAYSFPNFRWNLPEITRVVRSFEQLVDRLRGYRALNVRRLLLEKRRADIIAASIADGIFLLRDDEILYVNPVGERILGLPSGKSWKGLKLAGVEVPVNGDMPESVVASLQAIQTTISRTIPVERWLR